MKKMLVVIDPLKINTNLLDFALVISQQTGSAITGLFIEPAFSDKLVEKDLHGFPVAFTTDKIAKYRLSLKADIEETFSGFERKCLERGIPVVIHRNMSVPVEDIVAESRFADLILMDAGNEPSENTPADFMREILIRAECPVLLAPEHVGDIHEIIFCYDGSRNAMYAIRWFSCLFPQYKDKKLVILEAVNDGNEDRRADKRLKEWAGNHYAHFQHEKRAGTIKQILMDAVFKKKNIFIVMGSFGRSALSVLFKKPTAEFLIKLTTQPVFIAHS